MDTVRLYQTCGGIHVREGLEVVAKALTEILVMDNFSQKRQFSCGCGFKPQFQSSHEAF